MQGASGLSYLHWILYSCNSVQASPADRCRSLTKFLFKVINITEGHIATEMLSGKPHRHTHARAASYISNFFALRFTCVWKTLHTSAMGLMGLLISCRDGATVATVVSGIWLVATKLNPRNNWCVFALGGIPGESVKPKAHKYEQVWRMPLTYGNTMACHHVVLK